MTDLAYALEDDDEQEEPGPIPTDGDAALDHAERYLRAIRSIDAKRARIEAHAKREHERIDRWLEKETTGLDKRRAFLTQLLDSFARAWKARTHLAPPKLINGTLRLSAPRRRIEVDDLAAFKDWAEGNARLDLLRIKIEPNKENLHQATGEGPLLEETEQEVRRAAVTPDGEVVPGIQLVMPRQDSFSLTVAE